MLSHSPSAYLSTDEYVVVTVNGELKIVRQLAS